MSSQSTYYQFPFHPVFSVTKPNNKQLQRHLYSYWVYQSVAAVPAASPYFTIVLPDILAGFMFIAGEDVVLHQKAGRHIRLKSGHLYVCGAQTRGMLASCRPGATIRLIGFDMPAHQLFSLIDTPLYELTNEIIDFSTFSQPVSDHVCELLDASPYSAEALEAYLLSLFKHDRPGDAVISGAVHEIMHYQGKLQIKALAEQLNTNKRTLLRKFSFYQGINPKEYSRIVRFRHIYKLLMHQLVHRQYDFFDCVMAGNYFDQTHLIKEFRHFLDTTPGELVRISEKQ